LSKLIPCQIKRFTTLLKPVTEGNIRIHWGSFWGRK